MRYELRLLGCAVAVLLAVGAVNYAIDPFGVFHAPVDSRPLDNEFFQRNVRLAKARIVSGFRPESVVLGSSRAEIGISPADPAWRYERVYNLGLPHGSFQETGEYFEHAIAAGALKQAVVGLDFFQFNPLLGPRPDFSECRLERPGSLWTRIRAPVCDLPVLLFSRSTLVDALLGRWRGREAGLYLRDGSRSAVAKEAELRKAGSQHAAFLRTEFEFFRSTNLLRGFLETEARFEDTSGPHFETMLRRAYRHGIDLRFYISPAHAQNGVLIAEMGLNEEYGRWKRYLVATTERVADDFNAALFPIWDFSDYTEYTTEPMPPLEDTDARMKWHWESSHFTSALGDRVLDHVLGGEVSAFGTRLTLQGFEDWSLGIERRQRQYVDLRRAEIELMRAYLSSPEKRLEIDSMLARQN